MLPEIGASAGAIKFGGTMTGFPGSMVMGVGGLMVGSGFDFMSGDIVNLTVDFRTTTLLGNEDGLLVTRTISVTRGDETFTFVKKNH
ncbi:hypothetical protein [Microbulbifer sp. VAAF005]|uniref:hypothetical protein n=1 Tax=Microbulbifer sp. VAAF005 TaxID=3034230 RepID=UPI0024ACB140|nr:hypothetical protein [Microbulbifer sp. VAAF005]WHI47331.1 hypothetical protein P0078_02825 [Microbulbifer sp. VAAF005]